MSHYVVLTLEFLCSVDIGVVVINLCSGAVCYRFGWGGQNFRGFCGLEANHENLPTKFRSTVRYHRAD